MNIYDAVRARYSVRKYLNKEVEEDKLMRIMEAARLAPSASNRQEWRFIVVQDKETRTEIMKASDNQKFIGRAPVVIVCCADTDEHIMLCGEKCYPIDLAIAIDHITLAAVEEGLGTCWIGHFFEQEIRKILEIPHNIKIVELLTVGYPVSSTPVKKTRKNIEEILMFEKWNLKK